MAHVRITGHAKVPVEQWWAVATDLKRLPEWHTQVMEVRDVVGEGQVGTSATLVLNQMGATHEYRAEVTEFEPLRLVKQVGREVRPGTGTYTSISRFAPAPDGGTDWEWEQEVEPPKGALGAMTDRLMVQPAVEQFMQKSTERLAALIEGQLVQPA